ENRAYFFDSGIIIRGLVTLWRATGEAEFLDTAALHGIAMARAFEDQGQYAPILQLPPCEPVSYGNSWSNNPGCYQLKSALGWLELFRESGEPMFERHFETALDRALRNADVFLPGTPDRTRVMDRLHAYSYFLEALLAVHHRLDCADAIRT